MTLGARVRCFRGEFSGRVGLVHFINVFPSGESLVLVEFDGLGFRTVAGVSLELEGAR